MIRFRFIVLAVVLGCFGCGSLSAEEKAVVKEPSVLATLDKGHPRLMLKDDELKKLKELYKTDKALQKCVADVLKRADEYRKKAPPVYKKIGKRLLKVSRDTLRRTYALALAWRWTGEEKYAVAAVKNLLAVCEFDDWNAMHFLDTAEMSHAVGIGYDWLYSYMDEPTRKKIRAALIKHGLEEGIAAYAGTGTLPYNKTTKSGWWAKSAFNWNLVCNSGLVIGALAIAETDPEYAEKIIPNAVASMPIALASYAPDGAWMEGPGYWHYASRYVAYGLAAMESSLGTDFGLSESEGLSVTGLFPIYATGPTGLYLNFADSSERKLRKPMACLFWLARKFDNSFIAAVEHETLDKYKAAPEHLVWYVPRPAGKLTKDLDRYFRSEVEVAVMRSGWTDENELFIGVKGGYNLVNHGHLDLGSFEFDAMGVRWARDLGKDDYNLPDYWDRRKGGKRWQYYRLRSASHNVPLLNRAEQDETAVVKFLKFNSEKKGSSVVIDLTSAYAKYAKKVTRGVAMVQGRRAILVQDEFMIEKPCEVLWGMTTDAFIEVKENGIAELKIGDKKLIARVLSPAGAGFEVGSAEQKRPEKPNIGVRRLIVRLPESKGDVTVAVLLSPVWGDGKGSGPVEIKPLAQW